MAEKVHSEVEIVNLVIRCQNRIHFELERLESMVKEYAELDQRLNKQGALERTINELNGKNAEVRTRKEAQEEIMKECLMDIAEQISRQNQMMDDVLDYIASQPR